MFEEALASDEESSASKNFASVTTVEVEEGGERAELSILRKRPKLILPSEVLPPGEAREKKLLEGLGLDANGLVGLGRFPCSISDVTFVSPLQDESSDLIVCVAFWSFDVAVSFFLLEKREENQPRLGLSTTSELGIDEFTFIISLFSSIKLGCRAKSKCVICRESCAF